MRQPADNGHREVAAEMLREMQQWGAAKAPITTSTGDGHRFVAVGSSIYVQNEKSSFHEFLIQHAQDRLAGPWTEGERVGVAGDRHTVAEWLVALGKDRANKLAAGPSVTVPASPGAYDMLRLAYDLYTIRSEGLLERDFIKRLQNRAGFAGARYELAVAAAFVRGGFSLHLKDPSKGIGKPCEFDAASRDGSERYSVEAKCRHRPGVLGVEGIRPALEDLYLDVGRLVRKALEKDAIHHRVIFVDVSLPHVPTDRIAPQWFRDLRTLLEPLSTGAEPAFIFATNSPNRYLDETDYAIGDEAGLTCIGIADPIDIAVRSRPGLIAVLRAWTQHDRVPSPW